MSDNLSVAELKERFSKIEIEIFENDDYVLIEFDTKSFFENIGMMEPIGGFVNGYKSKEPNRMILKFRKNN